MQVSQLLTVQGCTSQSPVVLLTLYPIAQDVQVAALVQAKQCAMTEQLSQALLVEFAYVPLEQMQAPFERVKVVMQALQLVFVQLRQYGTTKVQDWH